MYRQTKHIEERSLSQVICEYSSSLFSFGLVPGGRFVMSGGQAGDGSYPHSDMFLIKAPVVKPDTLTLKTPCEGKPSEVLKISIRNPGPDQLIYKMTTSKPKKFKFPNKEITFGFVDPTSNHEIKIQPKKLPNANDFCKFDGFNIELAPMPKGNLWDMPLVWKKAKQFQKQMVHIKVTEEEDEEESEDE